jgi:hypothetical protein
LHDNDDSETLKGDFRTLPPIAFVVGHSQGMGIVELCDSVEF